MKNSGIKHGVVKDLSEQTPDVEMAETGASLVIAVTSEMGMLSSGGNVVSASAAEPQPTGYAVIPWSAVVFSWNIYQRLLWSTVVLS